MAPIEFEKKIINFNYYIGRNQCDTERIKDVQHSKAISIYREIEASQEHGFSCYPSLIEFSERLSQSP